jgi:hypothetical protein
METHDDPVGAALARRLGDDAARRLLTRARSYSNYPNAVKGAAKWDGGPEVEAAALAVVEDEALAGVLGLGAGTDFVSRLGLAMEFWPLLTLAARCDVGVVDRVAPLFAGQDYAGRLFAAIRRAAAKHAGAPAPSAVAPPGPDVPAKLSEVSAWLAAHPAVDPGVLGPRPGQKAAARLAAVRALGTLATPRALAVLGRYADRQYTDALLAELHRAWSRFDRRTFAATMFKPGPLNLGVTPTLEGIGAVPGLTSLRVIMSGRADLTPLAECTALHTLTVAAHGEPGLLGVEPLLNLPGLTELHLTDTTRNADLAPLAATAVRRLRINLDGADSTFLLKMPRLDRLLIADESPRAGTGDVLTALVRRGTQVTIYRHQAAGFPRLVEAGSPDVVAVEQSGYLAFTSDNAAAEGIRRRLFSNSVP